MSKNRLIIIGILLLTTVLAVGISFLLTQSETLAIGAYGLLLGASMIFIEPFTGLLNYLIFLYMRPQEFIPGFIGAPIMLIISAATAGFTLIHMAVKRNTLGLRHMPQNYFVLWFFAAIPMSHLRHFNMNGAVEALNYFLPVALLYYLVATLVTSEKKLGVSLTLIMLMTLFLAGQGIYQYFTGFGIAGQELFQDRIVSIGIFSDPNDLALAMLMILPFPVLLFAETRNLLLKILYALFALTLAVTVFFTESRGGILSLGLLMLIVAWRRYGMKLGIAMGTVMAAVIVVLGPARMSSISTQEASAHARVASWTVAFDLLQWFPGFGVGQGMFTSYHPKTAHNSMLLAAGELGLFGLIPWMLLFYVSVKNLIYVKEHAAEEGRKRFALLTDAVLLGLVGFFCGAMFLSRTYSPLLFIMFGLAAATTGIFIKGSGGSYALFEKRDWRNGLLIIFGSLILLKFFLLWAW